MNSIKDVEKQRREGETRSRDEARRKLVGGPGFRNDWNGMGREIYFWKGCDSCLDKGNCGKHGSRISDTRRRLSFQNTRMNGRAVCLISDSLNSKELFRDEAAPR